MPSSMYTGSDDDGPTSNRRPMNEHYVADSENRVPETTAGALDFQVRRACFNKFTAAAGVMPSILFAAPKFVGRRR